jgi:hypothetical protein
MAREHCGSTSVTSPPTPHHETSSLQGELVSWYPILSELKRGPDIFHTRLDTLTDLALLAPAIHALGSEDAVTQACAATLEVGYWWP